MIIRNAGGQAVFNPEKMGKASLAMTERFFVGLNAFEPGQEHKLHTHAGQDKLYFVLEGRGEVTVGAEKAQLGPGDLVVVQAGEEHALRNWGPERLVVMVMMAPPPTGKS